MRFIWYSLHNGKFPIFARSLRLLTTIGWILGKMTGFPCHDQRPEEMPISHSYITFHRPLKKPYDAPPYSAFTETYTPSISPPPLSHFLSFDPFILQPHHPPSSSPSPP